MSEIEIPKDFYSFETNQPFERCIECDKYLLDDETEYIIEKAVKNYEGYAAKDVVFDYAICMDCAERMRKEISKESWQNMMRYFQDNMNMERRMRMQSLPSEEGLKTCMIKDTPMDDCREYQIYAHCKGGRLNMDNPPYMISGEVMEELLPLLSDKTIDEMNGFLNKHFSPDPSLMEPTPPRIVLV
ncbi:MAG: hypothetical protein RLN88_05635 [Ekhidna sp.]|uniref:hypothetical protein n=1 Tax=Ekhidna sp. TaxID=2608089 RepID=UPI0032EBDE9D